ncbi:MAG TPA: response regulator transcription factor [Thermomicrobiales bacterium]|nr:response regulator transcription factor [Thermomicrobiales bacterium]
MAESITGLIERPVPATTIEGSDPDLIRVAIVAHGHALHASLRAMIEQQADMMVLGSLPDALESPPHVVLLDASAVRLLETVVIEHWPQTRTILIGMPDEDAEHDWREHASGVLTSTITASALAAAIRAVAVGLVVIDPELEAMPGLAAFRTTPAHGDPGVSLTPRERQVLELVARGYPNKSIAYELGITEHTAKFHVGSLLAKLGAASRAEIVSNATRVGLLTF